MNLPSGTKVIWKSPICTMRGCRCSSTVPAMVNLVPSPSVTTMLDEVAVVAALAGDGLFDLYAHLLGQQARVDEVDAARGHVALQDAAEGHQGEDLGVGRVVDISAGEDYLYALDRVAAYLPVEDAHLLGQADEGLQLGEGLLGDGGDVDRVLDYVAAEPGDDLGHHFFAHALGGFEGGGAQMGRAHHGVELVERVALLRLFAPGVDGHRGDMARWPVRDRERPR